MSRRQGIYLRERPEVVGRLQFQDRELRLSLEPEGFAKGGLFLRYLLLGVSQRRPIVRRVHFRVSLQSHFKG